MMEGVGGESAWVWAWKVRGYVGVESAWKVRGKCVESVVSCGVESARSVGEGGIIEIGKES